MKAGQLEVVGTRSRVGVGGLTKVYRSTISGEDGDEDGKGRQEAEEQEEEESDDAAWFDRQKLIDWCVSRRGRFTSADVYAEWQVCISFLRVFISFSLFCPLHVFRVVNFDVCLAWCAAGLLSIRMMCVCLFL